MAKNTLSDLNNHLFLQLERLNDEDLTTEQLQKESLRAKHMANIGKQIIENAKVTLEAAKVFREDLPANTPTPDQFKLKQ